jgi:hypothetical protein
MEENEKEREREREREEERKYPFSHFFMKDTPNYNYNCAKIQLFLNLFIYMNKPCTPSTRIPSYQSLFFPFFFFLRYWGLNSGPTPSATPPALFCEGFFKVGFQAGWL